MRSPSADRQQADREPADFDEFAAGQDPLDIEAATWVARSRNGMDELQHARLQAWLAADPRHLAAFEGMDGLFGRLKGLRDEPSASGLRLQETPAPAPEQPSPRASPDPVELPSSALHRPVGKGRAALRVAALAMVLLIGGWIGLETWRRQPTFEGVYATVQGQQRTVGLPDGSTVLFDAATQADVRLYRDRREVRLVEGQAMFTVRGAGARAFHVRAGALRVTVVGTRFSVRHTRSGLEAGRTVVEVEEGHVRVASVDPADQASVDLMAYQRVVADAAGRFGPVTALPPGAMATWRTGRVTFNDTPLGQALAEFERYGRTGLVVRDPAVAAMPVGGSYSLQRLQSFAEALPQVLPVRLEPRDGQMEIVRRARK